MITRDAVRGLYGADVYSTDGDKIGSAGQVYLDNDTGLPAWLAVRTGLFGKKESFVPLQDATLTDGRLEVPFAKSRVKHAPRIDQDGELSPADEDELYRYYGTAHDAEAPPEGDERGSDDAMTRSEERLVPHTRTEVTGKARLRKYVVTEQRQVDVPVTREEVRLEQEPADSRGPVDAVPGGRGADDEDPGMTLWAEEPVVTTRKVPVERVRLRKDTVTDHETVSGEVRKERIELEEEGR
ncbi:PRC and DUF2382 domain-containing protein [Actinoplanes sp. RD1]|uniref:PRC and DUF2382 domain-containing protein n=1 Tax=Actinoplanes sp. RD1 TaxID=3064538 RepID=UPI00274233FC|nr:PRC and DUF2382 domain-containing protein [Actinoplanes sp. RD1]